MFQIKSDRILNTFTLDEMIKKIWLNWNEFNWVLKTLKGDLNGCNNWYPIIKDNKF